MERLTKWENGHAYYPRCFEQPCYGGGCKLKDCPFETAVCERLAAYEDTGLTPDQVVNAKNIIDLAFAEDTSKAERIRKLVAADDEGRVLILPCAPDAIYWERSGSILAQARFEGLHVYEDGTIKYAGYGMEICAEDIGKTVFLTREEAEKALQEMEGKKDGNETSM